MTTTVPIAEDYAGIAQALRDLQAQRAEADRHRRDRDYLEHLASSVPVYASFYDASS